MIEIKCKDKLIYFNDQNMNPDVYENMEGTKEWYLKGQRHKKDGPAIKYKNGDEEWYFNDKLHREDGPAIDKNGYKCWLINGQRHRIDGPAIENIDYKAWYLNGKCHRIDGPAIEDSGNIEVWYVNDIFYEYEKLKDYVIMITRFLKMVKYKKITKKINTINIMKKIFCNDISFTIIQWI